MKQNGYFLVKVGKVITLYLWSLNKKELEELLEKGMQVVPYFECGNEYYIEVNGKKVAIR